MQFQLFMCWGLKVPFVSSVSLDICCLKEVTVFAALKRDVLQILRAHQSKQWIWPRFGMAFLADVSEAWRRRPNVGLGEWCNSCWSFLCRMSKSILSSENQWKSQKDNHEHHKITRQSMHIRIGICIWIMNLITFMSHVQKHIELWKSMKITERQPWTS